MDGWSYQMINSKKLKEWQTLFFAVVGSLSKISFQYLSILLISMISSTNLSFHAEQGSFSAIPNLKTTEPRFFLTWGWQEHILILSGRSSITHGSMRIPRMVSSCGNIKMGFLKNDNTYDPAYYWMNLLLILWYFSLFCHSWLSFHCFLHLKLTQAGFLPLGNIISCLSHFRFTFACQKPLFEQFW